MKPGECVIEGPNALADMLIACVPMDWPVVRGRAALASMMNRAVRQHLTYGQCWSAIWPESDAEWEAVADDWLGIANMGESVPPLPVPEPLAVASPTASDANLRAYMVKELEKVTGIADVDELIELATAFDKQKPEGAMTRRDVIAGLAVEAYKLGFQRFARDNWA